MACSRKKSYKKIRKRQVNKTQKNLERPISNMKSVNNNDCQMSENIITQKIPVGEQTKSEGYSKNQINKPMQEILERPIFNTKLVNNNDCQMSENIITQEIPVGRKTRSGRYSKSQINEPMQEILERSMSNMKLVNNNDCQKLKNIITQEIPVREKTRSEGFSKSQINGTMQEILERPISNTESVNNNGCQMSENIVTQNIQKKTKLNIYVARESIDSLSQTRWLELNAVTSYWRICLHEYNQNNIGIIPMFWFTNPQLPAFHSNDVIGSIKQKKKLASIILNQNHFSMVFIDCAERKFYYIDTLKESENLNRETYFKCWNDRLKEVRLKKIFKKESIKHCYQSDDYNCGVYVCVFFEQILKESTLDLVMSSKMINTQRLKIKMKLLQYVK